MAVKDAGGSGGGVTPSGVGSRSGRGAVEGRRKLWKSSSVYRDFDLVLEGQAADRLDLGHRLLIRDHHDRCQRPEDHRA
jgi:hypothetical protein